MEILSEPIAVLFMFLVWERLHQAVNKLENENETALLEDGRIEWRTINVRETAADIACYISSSAKKLYAETQGVSSPHFFLLMRIKQWRPTCHRGMERRN